GGGEGMWGGWTSVKNVFGCVAGGFLPQIERIEQLSSIIVRATGQVTDFIRANRGLILAVAAVGAGLVTLGAVVTGVGLSLAVAAIAAGGVAAPVAPLADAVSTASRAAVT